MTTPGGFGGVHVDDGVFVVEMRQPALAEVPGTGASEGISAMGWVQRFYGDLTSTMPVEVRAADYSFAELMGWYDAFREVVFTNGGSWTDIQESKNRLVAALTPGSDFEAVEHSLEEVGMPLAAVNLRVAEAVRTTKSILNDRFRPVEGGVNSDGCTVGFNVLHWDAGPGFVTAAHCTPMMGEISGTGDVFPQPGTDNVNAVGVEEIDPPFWTGTNSITGDSCPSAFPGGCRYADAVLVAYNAGVSDTLGWIARPECKNCGSLEVDSAYPHFVLIDEWHSLAEGQTVNRVGRVSGWETGSINNTCVDKDIEADVEDWEESYPPGTALLCQVRVNSDLSNAVPGDSGGPLTISFSSSEEVHTRLAGVQWLAQSDGGGDYWYSTIGGVRVDLDPNTSRQCDGLETIWGGGCDGPDGDVQPCDGDIASFQCES